jgi:hypothetical protein
MNSQILFITSLLLIICGCNTPDSEIVDDVKASHPGSDSEMVQSDENINSIETHSACQHPLAQIFPQKIIRENSMFVDNNNILHLIVSDSNIPQNHYQEFLAGLFPQSELYQVENNDVYQVFNIVFKEKKYHAVLVSENTGEQEIISQVFVAEGIYTPKTLEILLS